MLKLNAKLPKDLLPSLFSKKVTYATFAKEESDHINHDGHCKLYPTGGAIPPQLGRLIIYAGAVSSVIILQ